MNDNLDEGPIIMQDVIHVDHTYTAEDMMRAGRDVEKRIKPRAVSGSGAAGLCLRQSDDYSLIVSNMN